MKLCLLLFTLFTISNAKLERLDETNLGMKPVQKNEYNFLNRKLETIKNKTHFEFLSKESETLNKKNIGFRFMNSNDGVELNFNANKNVSEYTKLVFKKIVYNGETLYEFKETDFDDMVCVNSSSYKSCVLSTKDSFMEVRADFNTELYNVTFNNKVRRYFPTDIKVTITFNTTLFPFKHNDSFILVSKIKTDNKHYFDNQEKNKTEDNYYGNLTYMSFENYALGDDESEYPVVMLENTDLRRSSDESDESDEKEFHFHFNFNFNLNLNLNNMTKTLTWDPTFGATASFVDVSDLSSSSGASVKFNIFVLSLFVFISNVI